jgi:hypothetical protein
MEKLDRRLRALEGQKPGAAIACILMRDDETADTAQAKWEQANGPLGDRQPWIVRLAKSSAGAA